MPFAKDLPRRMWARSQLAWLEPLIIGETYSKSSEVKSVTPKTGKTGELLFVVVDHEFSHEKQGLCLKETHHIVYREPNKRDDENKKIDAPKNTNALSKDDFDWVVPFSADPVLLFQYSALTYNSHRIHYDQTYVRNEEFYPNLIVHGPLLATLSLEFLKKEMPDCKISAFDFKMLHPIFVNEEFWVCGRKVDNAVEVAIFDAAGNQSLAGVVT